MPLSSWLRSLRVEYDASRLVSDHDDDLVLEADRQPERINIKRPRLAWAATNKIKLSKCSACIGST